MKNLLSIILFFSLVFKLNAQSSDSLIVIQVDSLINVSRSLTNDREFERASEINHIAEMLTVENLGKESATYGNVCFNKGRILYYQTNYVEAEKWYLLSMNVRDKSLGKKHVDYAWSLNNLAILYFEVGQLKKAEKLYLEALEIRKNALGKEHPQFASSLNNLGNLYVETGHYNKAEPLLIEALTIRKKVLGVEHVDYGSSLYNLGRLYRIMGKYEKAELLSIEEKIISEKLRGKEHPDYASTLLNLGILYIEMGKYKQAESLYLEAKTIQEKIFGKEHPDYASTLNNLAILYFDMNQYELAEPFYIESKDIRRKIFGEEHPDYATSLDNLARFYYNLGEYGKAEPLHLEAKAIRERVLGKDHPDYASGLNNLAILYIELGQFEKAESLYLEAKMNWEKSLGNENPKYANILNNLADLYVMTQNYSKAEQFMLEAITITEKLLGKEHPDYARDLNNLGIVYLKTGAYKKAEPLFSEAKTALEKSVGKLHSTYAATLNNLADFYQITKNYKKAEILYLQIKEINKLILGKEHPYYSINLNNLAKLYEIQGRFSESENHLNEYFAITNSNLTKSVAFLSEQELAKYVTVNTDGGLVSSFLLSREYKNILSGILPAINFNQALFQKGFLLSSVSRLNRLVSFSTEAALTNKLLKSYRFRLAKEYAVPIAARDTLVLVDLEEKTNIAEKKLARIVAGYSEANRQYTWREVQAALAKSTNGKMGIAAIEFVHFKLNFPKTSDSIYYAALLLTPGLSQVKFIPLFEEKVLDSILKQEKSIFLKTNALYASRGVNPIYKNNVLSENLYSLIWKPIEKELKNISTVYFSASGSLNQLNLGAIPIDEKEVLFDKYNLIQLNSTRQLVDSQEISFNNQTAVLFGGIQYEMDSNAINLAILHLKKNVTPTSRGLVGFIQTDSTLRGGIWGYLPGTENEISVLEKSLQSNGIVTETYRNYAATEEAFKYFGTNNTESPRILHIATHGYFFPDRTSSATGRKARDPANSSGTASEGTAKAASIKPQFIESEVPVFKMSDHPMLRSGLIMAGGNAAWQGKPTIEGREDGILTAYEISQMNLSNTELVVLSACETGLGDIQGNEGVYGLQRAFKIAGAKYLIMSLWQVPDKQTSMLMISFYKKWLEHKMTIPDAFHAAQKELREAGLDPYQWAGFVLVE